MVTMAGLCFGISAIRFAMLERWDVATALLVAAALMDSMDGLIARMLKATSDFGAQLDSLSDVISFGVAPAIVFYLWALEDFKRFGWAAVLFYIVCCALRLARFNVSLQVEKPQYAKYFFTGIPAPGAAMLAIIPIMASFEGFNLFEDVAPLAALYLVLLGGGMASRIPTPAPKNFRIEQSYVPFILIGATVILSVFVIEPWLTMTSIGIIYIATLPVSAWFFYKKLGGRH
jgi:CDP-diacylglycerol--serine O-phosphatidyltransferase